MLLEISFDVVSPPETLFHIIPLLDLTLDLGSLLIPLLPLVSAIGGFGTLPIERLRSKDGHARYAFLDVSGSVHSVQGLEYINASVLGLTGSVCIPTEPDYAPSVVASDLPMPFLQPSHRYIQYMLVCIRTLSPESYTLSVGI